jgi:hypothetical protein
MKNIFVIFSLSIFFCFNLNSCFSQLLWKISGNGLKKNSYLFGTIHVGDERVMKLSEKTLKKIKEVDVFAGELKFNDQDMLKILDHLFMPNDTTLSDFFDEPQMIIIRKKLREKLGTLAFYAERMKPFFIGTLLAEQNLNNVENTFLDKFLQEFALKENREVIGLETVEEQLIVSTQISLKEQSLVFWQQIQLSEEEIKNQNEKLIQYYIAHDSNALYHFCIKDVPLSYQKTLLDNRNVLLTHRIRKILDKKSVFVAIGAAHLEGEKGVIELLRNAGYKIKGIF